MEISFVYCIGADSLRLADSVCLSVTWGCINTEATGSSSATEMSASFLVSIIDFTGFVRVFYDDMMTVGLGLPEEWFMDAFRPWVFHKTLYIDGY